MEYKIVSQSTTEPVQLCEARKHLRIEPFGYPLTHPDDNYVERLISISREWVEQYTRRVLQTKTIEVYANEFKQQFYFDFLPIQGLDSITYLANDNTTKTVGNDVYKLKVYESSAKLILGYNQEMPDDVIPEESAITITVAAGYTNGSSPDTYPLPYPIKAAMLLIIGHLYENRQEDVLGNTRISFNSLPMGVYSLLQPYRLGIGM